LSREDLSRLRERAAEFVEGSPLLRGLVECVQAARGRIYLWWFGGGLMARITPLGIRSVGLESHHGGDDYRERRRGLLGRLLRYVEEDVEGVFHGLGAFLSKERGKKAPVLVVPHERYKIPLWVVARPRRWYERGLRPVILEGDKLRGRVLVGFVSGCLSGGIRRACVYARRGGDWGWYPVREKVTESLSMAEAWLEKRKWKGWRW